MISSQIQSFSSPNSLNGFRTQLKSKTRSTVTCAVATAPARTSSTLYDVLGLRSGATCHEIKAAYRKLAREIHPDTVADHQKVESANEFIRIHSAYATLSDPDKRASYDREVVMKTAGGVRWDQSPAPASHRGVYSYSRAPRRRTSNWETDQCW